MVDLPKKLKKFRIFVIFFKFIICIVIGTIDSRLSIDFCIQRYTFSGSSKCYLAVL